MTSPNQSAENPSHSNMTISLFNEELQKEAPDLFQQLHATDSSSNILSSEQVFLDELKKHAPKLYEKLKNNNFKLKLDEPALQDWQEMLDHGKQVTDRLKEMKNSAPQQSNNKK